MTRATALENGIELTFADGCKGVVPFSDIHEVGDPADLTSIELPNPYQLNVRGAKGETLELPWDFVRHYCDSSYRPKAEALAIAGRQSLGKHIRAMRESAGVTQAQLATAAGIGRVTEVRIENGEQSPRFETLVALARALKR
ncbi:MAG: helix-turn-helix transcriptional regulator, partial [Chloroflexi bacterium]|nr:helix-turn-helix transcriptional regulator [Chloroflexota bacterium]